MTLRCQVTQERGQGHREPWSLLVRDDSDSLIKIQQNRTEPRGHWPGGRRDGWLQTQTSMYSLQSDSLEEEEVTRDTR